MRKDWAIKSLDEIATIRGGKRVPKGYKFETTPTLHPYITVSDFTEDGTVCTKNIKYISDEVYEQIKSYTISSQDIYISIAGTIGKTGSVPKNLDGANLTENACKLIFHKGINRKFVYYFTKTDNFIQQTGINTRVSAQPKLALVRLKTIRLPIPPLYEQKQIVAILNEAFEGIDRAIANAKKNLANARELFESYLNAIFTQKGDGWVEKKLEDVCEVKDGTHDSPKYIENGIPFITQKNIRKDGLTFESIKFISSSDHEKFYTRSNVAFGDIIISMIGANRGMACLVDKEEIFSIKNVGLIKESKNINKYFLLYFLKSKKAQMYVESASRGGAQPFIGLGRLREFPVSVAPQDSQATIVMKLDELYSETQRLEAIYRQKVAALKELKQSILQKAFTGELTADTVEKAA